MLKPMKPKKTIPNNIFLWVLVGLLVLSGIIALVSAFSGGDSGEDEVNAVYTNAAATLEAQQLTLEASAPSATPTTITSTPTITVTPLASPTLFPTIASSGGTTGGTGTGTGSFAVGCNNSEFVADVTFPDDTVVTPGQAMTKTWKLQNNGTCPWTPTYKVSFLSGNAMGGVETPIGVSVQPGQFADISIALTAPAATGDALGTWILTNDSNQNFGTWFTIKVKVGGTATTGTATTATATTVSSAPTAPTNLDIELTCKLGGTDGIQYEYVGTLIWTDNSTNETGFNVYVNGSQVASVAANITQYTLPAGIYYNPQNPTFAVEAVNNDVKSAQATASELCP